MPPKVQRNLLYSAEQGGEKHVCNICIAKKGELQCLAARHCEFRYLIAK